VIYHTTCSSKKMGNNIDHKFATVLKKCIGEDSDKRLNPEALIDSAVPCCGMAGDRGTRS